MPPSMSVCIIFGSARVLISPKFSISLLAIFLKIRRRIFPERVLGKALTNSNLGRHCDGADLFPDVRA